MRRPRSGLLLIATAAAGAAALPLAATAGPGPADLPDLVSEAPGPAATQVFPDGRLLLRFDGYVTNRAGAAPLEVRAGDPDASGRMREAAQWRGVASPGSGGTRIPPPPGLTVVFEAADGHNHFHLKNAAEYTLWTADRSAQVAVAQKTEAGFCLEDSEQTGGSAPDGYSVAMNDFCRNVPLVMGVTGGWRDIYSAALAYQWVDVSSVQPGRYQLAGRIDPANVIAEGQEGNNGHVFREAVVPGHLALAVNAGRVEPGARAGIRLASERFAAPEYAPGPVQYVVESLPRFGTLSQGGRPVAAGQVLSDPGLEYASDPQHRGPDSFLVSALDPGRPQYPRARAAAPVTVQVGVASVSVAISGAPPSLTAGTAVQLSALVTNGPPGVRWGAGAGTVSPTGVYVAPREVPKRGAATVTATSLADPSAWARVTIGIVPAGRARPAPAGGGPRVRVSARQLLINQRISQAAVRRANAIQAWLRAGVAGRDLRGGSIALAKLGPGVQASAGGAPAAPTAASPRPFAAGAPERRGEGRVRVERRQLLINQRISQAAVRRLNGVRARLEAGLTGGDLRDGAVGPGKLARGVRILATAAAPAPAASVTRVAPSRREGDVRLRLSARQLLINQRISQAAVRRGNALTAKLGAGLTGDDFRDGTITAGKLAATLRR